MRKRQPIPRTEPGQGFIDVETPIVSLLTRHGLDVQMFLKYIRSGMMDCYYRKTEFKTYTENGGIPSEMKNAWSHPTLPSMDGIITWRKATRAWSLDLNSLYIDKKIRYWSNVKKGITQISIENVTLPQTVVNECVGKSITKILEHPDFMKDDIIIHDIKCFTGGKFVSTSFAPSVQIHATVPKIRYDDPLPFEDREIARQEYRASLKQNS